MLRQPSSHNYRDLFRYMLVNVERIHLNHDPTSKTTGAFSIRRNERCDIVRPEWRNRVCVRPEDAPAAYACNRVENINITIQAEFSCMHPGVTKVLVRACDGHLNSDYNCEGNVLGTVAETEVRFVNRMATATLCLENVKLEDTGVGVNDVIWKWQFSEDGQNWEDITTSRHRIYSVIRMPTAPWEPHSTKITNTQLPWTEVLDFACRIAASTKDLITAARKVTLWANGLGKGILHYDDPGGGWTGFTLDDPPRFDCSEFLLRLNGGQNLQGPAVNCDDCAAIVTSFSNILGCELSEGEISGNFSFNLHPNRKIGRKAVLNGAFSRHNVGWLGECTQDDPVFDACLEVDSDPNPAEEPHDWVVPANIVFHEYRPQLTPDACNAVPSGKLPVRRIGIAASSLALNHLFTSRKLRLDGADIPQPILAWGIFLGRDLLEDLKLIDFRFIDTTLSEYLLQSFWCRRNNPDISFNVDMYEVKSGKSTAPLVKNILDRFHLRPEPIENPDFGTEAYASKGEYTIVFVRTSFVFLLRNTGKQLEPTKDFAKEIDKLITRLKQIEKGEANHGQA